MGKFKVNYPSGVSFQILVSFERISTVLNKSVSIFKLVRDCLGFWRRIAAELVHLRDAISAPAVTSHMSLVREEEYESRHLQMQDLRFSYLWGFVLWHSGFRNRGPRTSNLGKLTTQGYNSDHDSRFVIRKWQRIYSFSNWSSDVKPHEMQQICACVCIVSMLHVAARITETRLRFATVWHFGQSCPKNPIHFWFLVLLFYDAVEIFMLMQRRIRWFE
jgi:hypothetical protein